MLKLAFAVELRSVLRQRAGAVALLGFMVAGILAVLVGRSHVYQWQSAVQTAEDAEAEATKEALGYLTAGESGPEDRPWVDLAQPLWQDRYAGSRIVRVPSPLAGIASGAVDPAPAAFRMYRTADPMAAGGYRIENPELAAGAVDLVFVLAVLVPLLLGVLALGIGGADREQGIDRLVAVQAGEFGAWMLARTIAVAAVVSVAAVTLCLVSAAAGGASVADAARLSGLALVYVVLWSGLILAINAKAPSLRTAAFRFGLLWMVLCILMPTLSAELVVASVEDDFAIEETLEVRALYGKARAREIATVLTQLYAQYPELKALPAATSEEMKPSISRHAYDEVFSAAMLERHRARVVQEEKARRYADGGAWASPAVGLGLAMERLAGVGQGASSAYRAFLVEALRARLEWVLTRAWEDRPLDASDFKAMLAQTPSSFQAPVFGLVGPSVALILWAVVAWMLALLALRRA